MAASKRAEALRCSRRFKLLVVGSAHTGKGSLVKALIASLDTAAAVAASDASADGAAKYSAPSPDLCMENSMDVTDVTDISIAVPFVSDPRAPAGSAVGSPTPPRREKEQDATKQPSAAMVDISVVSPSPATRSAVVMSYRGAAAIIFVVRDGHPASMEDVATFAEDALAAQGANDTVQYLAVTGAKAPSGSTPGPVSLEVLDAATRILPRFGGIIDARRTGPSSSAAAAACDDDDEQHDRHHCSPVLLSSSSSLNLPTPSPTSLASPAADDDDHHHHHRAASEEPPALVGIASTVVRLAEQGLPILCNPVGPGARRAGDLDEQASKQGCCSCQ